MPEERRTIMRANRRRDTGPEWVIRSGLHARGARYRVDFPIRLAAGRPIRGDIVFPGRRIAVFIDGCFWHGCPLHGTEPATNADYWAAKIDENRMRDVRHTQALEVGGWQVVRVWEHENADEAIERILSAVKQVDM
ncbi:MAG: very short patch repair endonuclease [Solirubrobacterales bacterium]